MQHGTHMRLLSTMGAVALGFFLFACESSDDCELTATCVEPDGGTKVTDEDADTAGIAPPPDVSSATPGRTVELNPAAPPNARDAGPEPDGTDAGMVEPEPQPDAEPEPGIEPELEGEPNDAGASAANDGGIPSEPSADLDAGGAEQDAAPPPEYSLGGSVSGLTGIVELLVNDEVVSVQQDGAFSVGGFREGDDFAVSVAIQPDGQACVVENGSGTFVNEDIAVIAVTCANDVADLATLSVNGVSVDEDLSAVFEHDVEVALFTQRAVVVATLLDPSAALSIEGAPTDPEAPFELSLSLGANPIQIDVTAPSGRTQTYTVEVTRASSLSAPLGIISPSPGAADGFGVRVSVSGDAMFVDRYTEYVGPGGPEAFLFQRDGDEWAFVANVDDLITDPFYLFQEGALCGDNLIVGGIPTENSPTQTLYFLRRGEQGWFYETRLAGFDAVSDIACDEDRFAVRFAGTTTVYVRGQTTWQVEGTLVTPTDSVTTVDVPRLAIDDDVLVVGHPADGSAARGINGNPVHNCDGNVGVIANCAAGSGAAYVFKRNAVGTWQQSAYLKASNAAPQATFGIAVDVDQGTVVVGAVRENSAVVGTGQDAPIYDCAAMPSDCRSGTGAVYLFEQNGTNWQQVEYIKRGSDEIGQNFGAPVAIHGDLIVGGSQYDNGAAPSGGSITLFHRDGASVTELETLYAADAAVDDYFARWVSLSEQGLFAALYNRQSEQDKVYWYFE